MTLRLVSIFLTIGIVLGFLTSYFVGNISPFDKNKIESLIDTMQLQEGDEDKLHAELKRLFDEGMILEYLSTNAYIGFIIFLGSVFFIFLSIHSSIDKLFFKKFFEKPTYKIAIRRGLELIFILSYIIIGMGILHLPLFSFLAIMLIMIICEVLVTMRKL